jgi:hypothetical protein
MTINVLTRIANTPTTVLEQSNKIADYNVIKQVEMKANCHIPCVPQIRSQSLDNSYYSHISATFNY